MTVMDATAVRDEKIRSKTFFRGEMAKERTSNEVEKKVTGQV
jgi:hypothetical protein